MSFKLWKGQKTNDFYLIDRQIGSYYNISGVDAWFYTYQGPNTNPNGSTDSTKPDYSKEKPTLSSIGNLIWGETVDRKYSIEAITLPVIYQVQDAAPQMKLPGVFFDFNTMELTMHYNTMIELIGRKVMPGDVFELPNLRDTDLLTPDAVGINKFYEVKEAFKAQEGYSATWLHHIFKIRVKPLTDSPEFSNLLDSNKPDYPNNTESGGNQNSTYCKEMDIMNKIVAQADSEVPYIHWDNEHLFDDLSDIYMLAKSMPFGYEFPTNPEKDLYFLKLTRPELYTLESSKWVLYPSEFGTDLPVPTLNIPDGMFFFVESDAESSGFQLYQYSSSTHTWEEVLVPYTVKSDEVPIDANGWYYKYYNPTMRRFNGVQWEPVEEPITLKPFTTKTIAANRYNPHDTRDDIPPMLSSVEKGTEFPADPSDKMVFLRTDFTPPKLWVYDKPKKTWSEFGYGGRKPWTGANIQKTDYLNSDERVSIHDVVRPGIRY